MKNLLRFLGIIALVAVIGFTMAGCGGDDDSSDTPTTPTPTAAELVSVTANGTATPLVATTELTLTFNTAITGLAATHITLGTTPAGVTKGALSGSGPTYTLAISGTFITGNLSVAVAKSDYSFGSSSPKTVQIYGTGVATTGWGPWNVNWQPATEITDGYQRREMLEDATHYEVQFNGVWAFGTPGLAYEPINDNGQVVAYGANGPATGFRVRKGSLTEGVANTVPIAATSTTPAISAIPYSTVGLVGVKSVYIPAQHRENLPGTTTLGPYLPVTEIGADNETPADYAFMGLDIDSVSLPSYVRLIGENAFQNIGASQTGGGLQFIITRTYGASTTSDLIKIDNNAFQNCDVFEGFNRILDVTNPSAITFITDAYNLPYGLKEIGARAFEGCVGIKLIQIPATTDLVGNAAFNGWEAPQKISIYKVGNEQQIADAWNIQSSNSVWSLGIAATRTFPLTVTYGTTTVTYNRAAENGYIVTYRLNY
jgi:hypothetical protein